MDDVEINLVEHSNHKKAGCSKIKLFFLFSSAFLLWLIVTLIAFLTNFKSSGNIISNEANENKEKTFLLQKDADAAAGEEIGLIDCVYEISGTDKSTPLIGAEFEESLGMSIDEKDTTYSKEYKFDTTGEHKVQFKILKSLSMDNIFKGISNLKSVEMTSTKDCEITSMISTFEN